MAHIEDQPYQPPIPEQVERVPVPSGSNGNSDGSNNAGLDFTNQADVFAAIRAGLANAQEQEETGEPRQNPDRYSRVNQAWELRATKAGYLQLLSSKTIVMPDGTALEPLEAVLSNDIPGHIVVHLIWAEGRHFLCNGRTKNWIEVMRTDRNPHRSPVKNGRIPVGDPVPTAYVTIGGTIPVVHIDATELDHMGESQQMDLLRAGVADVEFIYETEGASGTDIPAGLIQQINYTLTIGQERAEGDADMYDIPFLRDEYRAYIEDIRTLVGKNVQPDKVWYTGKLTSFQNDVYPIWQKIRDDFNGLKRMFINGVRPTITSGTNPFLTSSPNFQFFRDLRSIGGVRPLTNLTVADPIRAAGLTAMILNPQTAPTISTTTRPLTSGTVAAPVSSYTPITVATTSLVPTTNTLLTTNLSFTSTTLRTGVRAIG